MNLATVSPQQVGLFSNNLSFKARSDSCICKCIELESTFFESLNSKKQIFLWVAFIAILKLI